MKEIKSAPRKTRNYKQRAFFNANGIIKLLKKSHNWNAQMLLYSHLSELSHLVFIKTQQSLKSHTLNHCRLQRRASRLLGVHFSTSFKIPLQPLWLCGLTLSYLGLRRSQSAAVMRKQLSSCHGYYEVPEPAMKIL